MEFWRESFHFLNSGREGQNLRSSQWWFDIYGMLVCMYWCVSELKARSSNKIRTHTHTHLVLQIYVQMKTIFKQFTKLKTWCACRNLLPSPLSCTSSLIYVNEWNNYRKHARFSFQPEKFFFQKINTCVRTMNEWYVDSPRG